MKKLLLVCSCGGHILQLYRLHQALFKNYDHAWVALEGADSVSLLKGQNVHWAFGPTNRSILNLVRNTYLAARIIWKERPTHIVSTGAAVCIPFMVVGRLVGCKTLYIESFARQNGLSVTGSLMYRVVQKFLVQSPGLAKAYKGAEFHGSVYPRSRS